MMEHVIYFLNTRRQDGTNQPVIVAKFDHTQAILFFIRVGSSILLHQTFEGFIVEEMELFDFEVSESAALDLSNEEHLILSEALNSPEGREHMGLE